VSHHSLAVAWKREGEGDHRQRGCSVSYLCLSNIFIAANACDSRKKEIAEEAILKASSV